MGSFERHLSLIVAGAMLAGLVLASLAPQPFLFLAGLTVAEVNMPVAILIWMMVFPMMVAIEPKELWRVKDAPHGLILTLVINWLIKPFTMAFLAVLFFRQIFSAWLSPEEAEGAIAGLILLGAAPCTAMVFVWSQLTKGDPNYTLVQVSLNDLILVVAYAPLVGILLGVTEIAVPWETLLLSTVLYVLVPLTAGLLLRWYLEKQARGRADAFLKGMPPMGPIGLILTIVLLFGYQAQTILERPVLIAIIAVPLLLQSYGIFAVAYGAAFLLKLPHKIAAPAAMIGTSNFFELAVAVAIGLYGLGSIAALATVVGVLIEVPVMLSLVALANRTRDAFIFGHSNEAAEETAS
ncbi:MAG: ACR3 family arsenite efflux transporter [Parvularcula sp.]|nr:ACR3 family arsenite efflux transporter [Parvularcula sp.]